MSVLTKVQVKNFLLDKQGYIKKSPINVAKSLWKKSDKHNLPKNENELLQELKTIKDVQVILRQAKNEDKANTSDKLSKIYEGILNEKNKPKRKLIFDLEVSPNIVFSWRVGNDVHLPHDCIIEERAIICVAYKWLGEDTVHAIEWNKGNDKELCRKFAKIMDSADEVITQNGDSFDIKWLRTRCLYHGIPLSSKFNSLDTLKMARAGFKFNSNKLDYMGSFLGKGGKIKTTFDLWRDIQLNNDPAAMKLMVDYCKEDINQTEGVYKALQAYSPVKKFKYK